MVFTFCFLSLSSTASAFTTRRVGIAGIIIEKNSKAIFIMIRPINQLISLAMQRQYRWNLKRCWSCIHKRLESAACLLAQATYWLGYQSLKPHPGSFILILFGKNNCFHIYLQAKELGYLSPGSCRVFQCSGPLGGPESIKEQRLQRQDCWGFGLWVFLFLLVSECQREVEAIT